VERKLHKIVLPGQTPQGEYILCILHKRTYDIVSNNSCVRANIDRKIISADQHWDDPMNSSVKFESDFVPWKNATDVVLNGKAYAPNGRAVNMLTASLTAGATTKQILVFGDRVSRFTGGTPIFTEPQPFTQLDLLYENAYGGADIYSDVKLPCLYPRNPVGKGFAIRNLRQTIEGLALPNLEDPSDRLTAERLCCEHFMYWDRQPMPQSFGWWGKPWQPRASMAGVMPADRATERELRKMYATAVPPDQRALYAQTELPDMNFDFFSGASIGLSLPFLKGDEAIRTLNVTPEGSFDFRLPAEFPQLGLDVGDGIQEPEVVLQTVMIRMEEKQADLVWRAAVHYPGPDWLPNMRRMEVFVA
jgi:hypothetical protein